MSVYKRGSLWWYSFVFAGRRIQEPAKTKSKTVAKLAEQQRRRELEQGFNAVPEAKKERVQAITRVAADYLEAYKLRHRSYTFAEYAVGHVVRHLGALMVVDVGEKTITGYQSARLKEKASAKSINEEIGFLLRLLGDHGDALRVRLRRRKKLKLAPGPKIGKAFSHEEKMALLAAARSAKSPSIYPALVLALNTGLRDAEIRTLTWGQVDLRKAMLTVGRAKTEAGEGRRVPLNSDLVAALQEHAEWYRVRFQTIEPTWYLFPAGAPLPSDPTRPLTSLKTAWTNVREKAGVTGRWHDNRHTLITDLAESGAGDEVIRSVAGHVSKQMLEHYSHVRTEAKRDALQAVANKRTRSTK